MKVVIEYYIFAKFLLQYFPVSALARRLVVIRGTCLQSLM